MSSEPAGDFAKLLALAGANGERYGGLGLYIDRRLEHPGYASPTNLRAFAWTGGDGVHFCFTTRPDGEPATDGPVVMVVPTLPAEIVVGETLREFLALGAWARFFLLEQLAYDGFPVEVPEEIDGDRAAELVDAFALVRWSKPAERLAALQSIVALGPRMSPKPSGPAPDPLAFWEGQLALQEAKVPRDEATIAHMRARVEALRVSR